MPLPLPHRRCILAALLCSLAGCGGIDTLSGQDNGEGIELIDALAGSSSRIVCILADVQDPCRRSTADVVVDGVPEAGQFHVEWRNHDTVLVYLFGGTVRHCQPRAAGGRVRVELRRLPRQHRGSFWLGTDNAAFEDLPDICGGYSPEGAHG
jgi:hypothetical protein